MGGQVVRSLTALPSATQEQIQFAYVSEMIAKPDVAINPTDPCVCSCSPLRMKQSIS